MSNSNNQNILFVVNPVAGGGAKVPLNQQISDCFEENGYSCRYEIFHTTGDNDGEQIAQLIEKKHPEKVVAVGGDGTIKLVAELIIGKDILLGIIPVGSANGMATELQIPLNIYESINTVINGTVKHMDVIRVNDSDICLHLSDIGMNAQLIKYYEENSWRGKFGYLKGAIKTVINRKTMRLSIVRGDEEIVRTASMVVLANARMYGTSVAINPDGNVFDGEFEIVILRRFNFWGVLKIILGFKNHNPKVLEILSAKEVNIYVKKKMYFQVDGEYKGKIKAISAKVEKGAIPILLPKNIY